jgi:hypothetical protein
MNPNPFWSLNYFTVPLSLSPISLTKPKETLSLSLSLSLSLFLFVTMCRLWRYRCGTARINQPNKITWCGHQICEEGEDCQDQPKRSVSLVNPREDDGSKREKMREQERRK